MEPLSNNFLSLVRTLGEAVSGDEVLLHFTANCRHSIAAKAKPARVGLWFYQLAGVRRTGSSMSFIR